MAKYVDESRAEILARLDSWLRIPGISADPAHAADVRDSAEWCAEEMRAVGLEGVRLLETAGHPSVYGEWRHRPDAPTVLVYGHHDVQPVDPHDAWVSPPFEPTVRDGQLFARGAVDDKGQVQYHLEVIRALLARDGRLPINVKLLVEGEEEIGSPHFEALLREHRELLRADVIVVSDTAMWAAAVPSMCTGMRGLVTFDVALRTASGDLHSGSFGGAVQNAAHVAAELVAALHDEHRRVTLPGFYDDVQAIPADVAASMAALPFEADQFRMTANGAALVGESDRSTLEQIWVRPTGEVTGLSAGYAGAGIKTIVPATATVKFTFRLVPNQTPERISAGFHEWLAARVPDGVAVAVTPMGAVAPALTPLDHPAVGAAARVIERVWGVVPSYTREGGSGPEEALGRVLGAPVVFLGVGLPDDQIHAPNERIVLEQFWKGLVAVGELWFELEAVGSTIPRVPRAEGDQ